jgi:antitoxin component of MazEF toxin-antitoxin module
MDSRKVIKIENSYYINIPSGVAQALEIMKGDRLEVSYIPGCGILISRAQGAGKVLVNLQSIERLERAADAVYSQLERRVKDLSLNFLSNLQARIVSDMARSGVFDLKARVEKLETKAEVSDRGRGKVLLLHKKKGNTQ